MTLELKRTPTIRALSLTMKAAVTLSCVGLPDFKAAHIAAVASQLRYMLSTLPQWETDYKLLCENDALVLSTLAAAPWECHWKSPAFVHSFKALVTTSGAPKQLKPYVEKALKLARKVRLAVVLPGGPSYHSVLPVSESPPWDAVHSQ